MSRLTNVILIGQPMDNDSAAYIEGILGKPVDWPESELLPATAALFRSGGPLGIPLWAVTLKNADDSLLLDALSSTRWRYPELSTLLLRSEDAAQWAVYRWNPNGTMEQSLRELYWDSDQHRWMHLGTQGE